MKIADKESLSICAIILAAGESKRFGPDNKLLAEVDGVAMLESVVKVIQAGGVKKTLVVTGADHDAIVSLLSGDDVEFVRNECWEDGMGTSLAVGVASVDPACVSGMLVCLGDLPRMTKETVVSILNAFQNNPQQIIVPAFEGRRGHPVVFPISYLARLVQLKGDEGAKTIIQNSGERLKVVPVDSSEIFRDLDTQDDLEKESG